MIPTFGKGGVLDLKAGVVKGKGQQIDLETGEIGVHSTAAIVKDVAIIGSAMREGATVPTHNNTKGLVRAFDVRTGKLLWTFNTIRARAIRQRHVGKGIVGRQRQHRRVDADHRRRGARARLPAGRNALVRILRRTPARQQPVRREPRLRRSETGVRKWHYQFVHHPIWNFDNSSAPLLLDITVNGKAIKAVASPSKLGWLYVFDRVTGQPVWPIEERPVPASDVPGEKLSPTQPFPTKPPAYARNYLKVPEDLIDFTPELRAQALERLKRYKYEPSPFAPPILGNANGPLYGALVASTATNWPGSGADPETHVVYAQAGNMAVSARSLVAPPKGFSDIGYVSGIAGQEFREVMGPAIAARPMRRSARRSRRRRRRPRTRRPTAARPRASTCRAADGEAAVRDARGDQRRSRRSDVAGAARRHARQHPHASAARGQDIPKTGQPGTSGRRPDGDQDARRDGRSADHRAAGTPARRDAARLRQDRRDRRSARSGCRRRKSDRR
jgi:quinoprotein glucose dehydrogenase